MKKIQEQYKDILWIQNEKNVGFAAAVNIGLSVAKGDYVVLVNPDSEIWPDALEAFRQFWVKNTECRDSWRKNHQF